MLIEAARRPDAVGKIVAKMFVKGFAADSPDEAFALALRDAADKPILWLRNSTT